MPHDEPGNGPQSVKQYKDPFASQYPLEGADFGRYQNLHEIGEGGMGRVYKAHDPKLGLDLAIKVLPRGLTVDEDHQKRFRREVQLLASINIPGVIRVFDCGEIDGWQYFSMEHVDGMTLCDYPVQKELDPQERLNLVVRLTEILTELHARDIVHRDLKPSNVMITHKGEMRLMDFGIAKSLAPDSNFSNITMIDSRPGTPFYMSPDHTEELQRIEVAKRADVYSLGVLTYELLAGRYPYDIENLTVTECMVVIREEPPQTFEERGVVVPPEIEKLVMSALEKDHALRPSAKEFLQRLRQALGLEKAPPKRSPWPILFSAAAALALVVGLHYILVQNRKKDPVTTNSELLAQGHVSQSSDGTDSTPIVPEEGNGTMHEAPVEPEEPAVEPVEEVGEHPPEPEEPEVVELPVEPEIVPEEPEEPEVVVEPEEPPEPPKPTAQERYAAALAEATQAYEDGRFDDAVAAYAEALRVNGYDEDAAAKLGKKRAAAAKLVAQAEAAATAKNWQKVLELTPQAAALDPANSRAFQLEQRAEMALKPRLTISAWADNKELKTAILYIDGERQNGTLPGTFKLKKGKKYLLRVEVPRTKTAIFEPYETAYRLEKSGENTFKAPIKKIGIWESPDINMSLIPIEPGTYTRGATEGNARPKHKVTISRMFWISRSEVTQDQYYVIMRVNPSRDKGKLLPIARVPWVDANTFCRHLTKREREAGRLPEGHIYRLPTEGEWEYVCRAGADTEYPFGKSAAELGGYEWYAGNSTRRMHQVCQKKPNAWGVYDMLGNVREWVWDAYGSYPDKPVIDPKGPPVGMSRVVRGGAWNRQAGDCVPWIRSVARSLRNSYSDVGFRVVLAPSI